MLCCANCDRMRKKYEKQRERVAMLEKKLLEKYKYSENSRGISPKLTQTRDFELDKSLLGTSPSQTNFYCF
jgi:hypothetical protein